MTSQASEALDLLDAEFDEVESKLRSLRQVLQRPAVSSDTVGPILNTAGSRHISEIRQSIDRLLAVSPHAGEPKSGKAVAPSSPARGAPALSLSSLRSPAGVGSTPSALSTPSHQFPLHDTHVSSANAAAENRAEAFTPGSVSTAVVKAVERHSAAKSVEPLRPDLAALRETLYRASPPRPSPRKNVVPQVAVAASPADVDAAFEAVISNAKPLAPAAPQSPKPAPVTPSVLRKVVGKQLPAWAFRPQPEAQGSPAAPTPSTELVPAQESAASGTDVFALGSWLGPHAHPDVTAAPPRRADAKTLLSSMRIPTAVGAFDQSAPSTSPAVNVSTKPASRHTPADDTKPVSALSSTQESLLKKTLEKTAQTSGAKVVDTVEHVSYAPLLSVEAASTLLPQATMTAPPNLHLLRSFGMLGQPMPASAHANASSAPRAYEAATVTPSSVGSPQQAHAQGGPAASYTGYFGDMSFKDATTPQSMEARPSDVRALPAPMAPPVLPSPHMSSSTHSSSAAGTASPPVMNSSRLGVVSVDLPPAYSPERTTDDDADDAPSLTLTAPKAEDMEDEFVSLLEAKWQKILKADD